MNVLVADGEGTNQWLLRVKLEAERPRVIEVDDGMQVAGLAACSLPCPATQANRSL